MNASLFRKHTRELARRPLRHHLRQLLAGWSLALILSLALLPWPVSAPAATTRSQEVQSAQPQAQTLKSAKAIAEEALRAPAIRMAPRRLEVNQPVQVSFETGNVLHMDITPDGKWLAYTRQGNGYAELWLSSLDNELSVLPRRLAPALADRQSPALSPDGRRIAFVGAEDDVKGDIYLLDLTDPKAQARKLTGRDTEDAAPCFSPDGKVVYFQQRAEGEPVRHIVALDLGSPKAAPRVIETRGDAAHPALSPDGRKLAFVSLRTGVSSIFVMDLPSVGGGGAGGEPRKLTPDALPQAYPRFTPDGAALLFTTAPAFGVSSGQGGIQTVIARAPVQGGRAEPLTSAQGADLSPLMAAGKLYSIAARNAGSNGPANIWSLPPEGEIPDKSAGELLALAETLASQLPVERHLVILALDKAARAAGISGSDADKAAPDKIIAAQALFNKGRQYESLGLDAAARRSFDAAAALNVQPQSGFAGIRALLLTIAAESRQALNDKGRQAALQKGLKSLAVINAQPAKSQEQARVQAQARLEQARLLLGAGDSKALGEALRILDAQLAVQGTAPEQAAEALFLKAETYGRIGQVQAVLPLYARVIREFPANGPWADLAVSRVLDRTIEAAGPKPEDQTQALLLLSGQNRVNLPKLSLGALNRLGDIYYAADEWSKAKDAYRQALDGAKSSPQDTPQASAQISTQVAAARLALAEILYREERFHQALDLYETEMASRPYEDRLYRLAKAAHLRKSTAAGDYLLRIGEVPSARAIFAGLLRDDPDFVPAHRGMIRASAALKTIPATLADYRAKLVAKPGDPTLLYAVGLTMTYLDGKAPLLEARDLIRRAIQKNGQVEYFHQTLGYIDEVLETVHGERGRLEAALESYQRARFLNSREQNPENAANLDLNIGNIHFLLGQYAQAFEEYRKRQDSKVAFDNPETEILFYQRFGTSAFQARERDKPIEAFTKSLELVESRIQPKYASEIFGRINKYVFDRVLTPALGHAEQADRAKALATRQSDLNNSLFEASIKPAGPPPDPTWGVYVKAVETLLSEQERIISELPPLMPKDREASMQTLAVMVGKVREALGFPPRFVQLRAELHDRLGLAYQEAGRWREAKEAFEKALAMNTALGLNQNLTANQRSVAYCAYMEAGLTTGRDRDRLLETAEAGFRRIPELVKKYGVADKKGGRAGKGLINIDLDVSLDKATASQAAYGFSAEQELRLAEAFLSRIATERGRPREALGLVERQSSAFEKGDVAPQDTFGAALLLHRAGLLESSLSSEALAFERFRRSAELSLEMKNPVSASLNVIDLAATLERLPVEGKDFAPRLAELRRLETLAAEALRQPLLGGSSLSAPAFHNIMAAHDLAQADRLPATDAGSTALHMDALSRAGQRLSEGLAWFKDNPPAGSRRALALNAALHLNMADLSLRLGEDDIRAEHLKAALTLADQGLLPGLRWRALAGLGRLLEALSVVQALPLDEAACGAGEITGAFAPLVAALIDSGKAEDAYNLSERLSELERVGRMGRLGVAQPTGPEAVLLSRTSLRLLAIRDLKARLAAAKDAKGFKDDDRIELSRRLAQEEEILARDLGPDRESLPGVARIGAGIAEQDWLTILHGLSLEAAAAAEAAVGGSAEQRARHAQLMTRLGALKAEAGKSIGRLDAPGALGLFLAAPSEAIDLMETLPKGSSVFRIIALPTPRRDALRWAVFRLDADSVRAVALGTGPRPVLPALGQGERRLLAFEDMTALSPQDLRSAQTVALSGTHLVRSLKARKPFRRNLVFITGPMSGAGSGAMPPALAGQKAFSAQAMPISSPGLAQAVSQAHTLVAGIPARQSQSAPSRQDELPVRFLALSPVNGEPLPLSGLAASMQDVSLAVLTQVPAEDLPLVAHLLSLYGVPSVLAAQDARFDASFLAAYAEDSAADARTKAQASGTAAAPWLLLGDPGLNAREAGAFAVTQFARYVRAGMEDFKAGRFPQALTLFENALRVARSSSQFNTYLPDLLSYSRESAYASEQFDKSLAFAKELALLVAKTKPDTPAHAEALMRLGLVYARIEQYAQAIPVLEQATEMLANLELAPKEIEALSSLGAVLENAIQFDRALKRFEGAAKLSQKAGTRELVAKQYMSIGRIYDLRLSQYAQAREAYGTALGIYTALGRKVDMAQAMLDIGRCARLIGNFTEAETRYADALKLTGTDKNNERLRARIVIEQANNAWQQARFQQAFDLQRQVLKSAEAGGWVLEQVIARNTAGLLWWSLGDHSRAVRELDAALPLARSLRIRQDEVATTLNNRGLVERDMGKSEQALKTLGEALTIDRAIRSRWAIAYDLRNIAQTYIRMGDPKKALPLLDEALGIVAATGNRINQAKILLARGEAQLLLSASDKTWADKAKASFSQADELARSMGLRDSQWRALHGLARLDMAGGRRPEAKALLIQAVDVIEAMRSELKVDQLKDGFIADKAVVYEDLVTLLADMGDVSEAFRTAERSRARNLIDLLGNKRRSPQRKEDQSLYERITAVRARLREQESLLASAQNTNEREVYAKGVKRLQDDYRDILLEIQASRPDIASLVSVNPLTLPEVQKMLEPGVALLSYYITANEILCWTLDHDRVDLTRTRLGRGALGRMILTYRRMLQNLEPVEAHSKELYTLLLAPVLPKLTGVKVLGIIPHDCLHTLAFATLSDGESSLLDRYPLFQLPSASVFKFTLERRKAERNTKVLAVGNPDLHDQSLELPFAEREVTSLAWNYPNMTALTRDKATKSWISEHIDEFGIIHLATHGEFDPVNPLFSALKLVGDKKEKDGDLDAAEIFDLRITADLIVLSACQTGLGKVSSGDEVKGLNQAFLYAGTHALVSSLWRVSDISTAMLMKQFYREYQTRPKAESLRLAMLHVKNRFPHPGYWGAFTLSGDYR